MTKYKIQSQLVDPAATDASRILATAHGNHVRPLCVCRSPNPEMYIAKVGSSFIVKRMPNTGALHAVECESYEPPAELSGLGEVVGSAIQEDVEKGITSLKLDFSLTKVGTRKPPTAAEGEGDTVRTDGKKLTLRGTLHYLWEQAGFNRWLPAMEGKRNWGVVRRHLMNSLADKEAKGSSLASAVYIPEPFAPDQKLAIAQRRSAKLAPLMAGGAGPKKLMVLIAEVKDITEARYDYKIIVKHLPDYHFMLNKDIYGRLTKRFAYELGMWRENAGGHLVLIATFGVGPTGYASIEEASLMMVSPEWVPVENGWDALLVHTLIQQRRSFMKGLRYNLASTRPLASAVTSDTLPQPVAMYLVPDGADESYLTALGALCDDSKLPAWFWQPGPEADVPTLPSKVGYEGVAIPTHVLATPAQAAAASTQESSNDEDEPEYLGEAGL